MARRHKDPHKCLDCKRRFMAYQSEVPGKSAPCYFCKSENTQLALPKPKTPEDILKANNRTLEKTLMALIDDVKCYIQEFDKVAVQPQSFERGRKLALLTNALNMAVDHVLHFTFKKDKYKAKGNGHFYSNIQWLGSDQRKWMLEQLELQEEERKRK